MKYCVEALISVANSTFVSHAVPLPICHLLKLLDYFLHHLSIPPQDLFKQVCCGLVTNIKFEHYRFFPFLLLFIFCLVMSNCYSFMVQYHSNVTSAVAFHV